MKCKNFEVCHNQAKKNHVLCDRCIEEARRMDDWLTDGPKPNDKRKIDNAHKKPEPV